MGGRDEERDGCLDKQKVFHCRPVGSARGPSELRACGCLSLNTTWG